MCSVLGYGAEGCFVVPVQRPITPQRGLPPALVTDVMGVICLALRSAPRDDERDAACSKECRIAPRAICTPWERIAAGGGRLIGRARAISLRAAGTRTQTGQGPRSSSTS